MAYATVAQYVARYGEVEDAAMLSECLDDASAAIDAVLDRYDIDYSDPSESYTSRLMRVCRSVANRIMPAGSEVPAGVTQQSQTAGPYTFSASYTPAYSMPKLLPSELAMLGVDGGAGRTLMYRTAYDGEDGEDAGRG